jgi:hypothetical protein
MLSGLGIVLCPMAIWRDARKQAGQLQPGNQWKKVRVLGVDGAIVLGLGEQRPVLVAVDMGGGEPVALSYVSDYDLRAVQKWLAGLVQRLGVSVIVTDDLAANRLVAERL